MRDLVVLLVRILVKFMLHVYHNNFVPEKELCLVTFLPQ